MIRKIEVKFNNWIINIFRVLLYFYVGISLFVLYRLFRKELLWDRLDSVMFFTMFIFLYLFYSRFIKLKIVCDEKNIKIYRANKIESFEWHDIKSFSDIFLFKNLKKLTFKNNKSFIVLKNIGNYKILADYISKYTNL